MNATKKEMLKNWLKRKSLYTKKDVDLVCVESLFTRGGTADEIEAVNIVRAKAAEINAKCSKWINNYKKKVYAKWTVWSLDCLNTEEGIWEVNDRHKLASFICEKDAGIGKLLSELESQDPDFCFLEILETGRIRCEWEGENEAVIYKADDDRPLYSIEKETAEETER